jgi:hypothetical protein
MNALQAAFNRIGYGASHDEVVAAMGAPALDRVVSSISPESIAKMHRQTGYEIALDAEFHVLLYRENEHDYRFHLTLVGDTWRVAEMGHSLNQWGM